MQNSLFNSDNGAFFSECRKYRYFLWRKWDATKPMILFIGLNPSTANENTNDRTIKRVMAIANHNGYGGVYMMNLFLFVSTDPDQLKTIGDFLMNDYWLLRNSKQCKDVLFAWGNFDVIKETGRDKKIIAMFPNAKAIVLNKSGSPKHPLYCKKESLIINFKNHE